MLLLFFVLVCSTAATRDLVLAYLLFTPSIHPKQTKKTYSRASDAKQAVRLWRIETDRREGPSESAEDRRRLG